MRRHAVIFVVAIGLGTPAFAQTPPTDQLSGWAQCVLDVRGSGYSDQQTHTWVLTGGPPTLRGAFKVYAATWSVTGSGSLQRSNGTTSSSATWTTTVPPMSAPIQMVIRASDGRLLINSAHSQLRLNGAAFGTEQYTTDGKTQSVPFVAAAYEWAPPAVEDAPTATLISGSNSMHVSGSVAPRQSADSVVTASCTWSFGRGTTVAGPPPPAGQPGGTAPGGGTSTTTSGNGTNTGSTGTGTTAGVGTTPGTSLPSGTTRPTVSGATLVGSCPAAPITSWVASPYCVRQGQQNVAVTLTAVAPAQFQQGTYNLDPQGSNGSNGLTLTSAKWMSPTTLVVTMNVSPSAPLGPSRVTFIGVPNGGLVGFPNLVDVLSASSPTSTNPLVSGSTSPGSTGSSTATPTTSGPSLIGTTTPATLSTTTPGTTSSTNTTTPPSPPTFSISSLSVSSGRPGDSLVINGAGFGTNICAMQAHFAVNSGLDIAVPLHYNSYYACDNGAPVGSITVPVPTFSGVQQSDGQIYLVRGSEKTGSLPFHFNPAIETAQLVPQCNDPDTKVTNSNFQCPFFDWPQWDYWITVHNGAGTGDPLTGDVLGHKAEDEFYVSTILKNGWVVDSVEIKCATANRSCVDPSGGNHWGASVMNSHVGTSSPFVDVHWWTDAYARVEYQIYVNIKGPLGLPYK